VSKFKSTMLIALDGTEIHFVVRGKSKAPTLDEIQEYCKEKKIQLASDLEDEDCGVPKSTIENYIKNSAPHLKTNFYREVDKNA